MLLSVDIEAVEPLADGAAFGAAGAYERVIGTAHGEVDPEDPANRGIVNIDKAPLNARGRVEYSTVIFILRPKDPLKGNGRILYEVNNRGRKMLFGNICDGPQGMNDPRTQADVGNGFPLKLGYTIVWSGWDPDAPRANMGLALTAPVATDNGKPIVQTVREEWVSGTRLGVLDTFKLSHEMASPEGARLTVRARASDKGETIGWAPVDTRSIRLAEGKAKPGFLYEFHYEAKNPKVQGLGFAATRDFVSWLRYDPTGVTVTGRPITHALAIGFSQSGRYLRDHIGQGFNRDEQGRRVFDGIHSHIAGIGRVFFNAPFAQPARTGTQHEDHDYPENAFPFSTATLEDPLTQQTGSLFRGDGSDPKLIETNTSTEYWQKGASLLTTDPLGLKDVALPENSRVYMIAGTQHGGRAGTDRNRPDQQAAINHPQIQQATSVHTHIRHIEVLHKSGKPGDHQGGPGRHWQGGGAENEGGNQQCQKHQATTHRKRGPAIFPPALQLPIRDRIPQAAQKTHQQREPDRHHWPARCTMLVPPDHQNQKGGQGQRPLEQEGSIPAVLPVQVGYLGNDQDTHRG